MIHNINRIGNFTASEIWKLTKMDKSGKKFGVPAIRYIMETNDERMLGQPIDLEVEARPLGWGKLLEPMVHDLLGLDYTFTSDVTDLHPTIPYSAGSKDGTHEHPTERAIIDYKAPLTKTSFVALVRPLYHGMEGLEAMYAIRDGYNYNGFEYPPHTDGVKYYWQLVDNGIINDVDYAELIIFMPYKSQLLEVGNLAGDDARYNWIKYYPESVPCLNDDGLFKNINIIRFKIPQADKDFLTEQILKGGEMLINTPTV